MSELVDTPDRASDTATSPEKRRITTDVNQVRRWAEERDMVPVRMAEETAPEHGRHRYRLVRDGELVESDTEQSWDEFTEAFHDEQLAFVYRDEPEAPSSDRLGYYELVERDEAAERAVLDDKSVQQALMRGETVRTEIVGTRLIERQIVERNTIESRITNTDVLRDEVVGRRLLRRDLVGTELIDEERVEIEVDEYWLLTREHVERKTVESRVIDTDVEGTDMVTREAVEATVGIEGVQQTILDSDLLTADTDSSVSVEDVALESEYVDDDTLLTYLVEETLAEDEVRERKRLRYELTDTELDISEPISSAVIATRFLDSDIETEADLIDRERELLEADTTDQEPVEISEELRGRRVSDRSGEDVGIVARVEDDVLYVDPHPSFTDRIKAFFNRGDVDESYTIEPDQIDHITEERVVLRELEER